MKTREARREFWRKLIAQQQQSGVSVRAFCQQHRTSQYSFYQWRKRLVQQLPVKFALVETSRNAPAAMAGVEVILGTGERLQITPGVDRETLRMVVSVLGEVR